MPPAAAAAAAMLRIEAAATVSFGAACCDQHINKHASMTGYIHAHSKNHMVVLKQCSDDVLQKQLKTQNILNAAGGCDATVRSSRQARLHKTRLLQFSFKSVHKYLIAS
jgi:hypothetical protein